MFILIAGTGLRVREVIFSQGVMKRLLILLFCFLFGFAKEEKGEREKKLKFVLLKDILVKISLRLAIRSQAFEGLSLSIQLV